MFPIKFGFLVFLQRLTRLLVCSHSRSCLCMCYQAPWRLHSASESDAALPERCLSGVPTSQLRQVGFFPGLSHAGLDGVMILTFEFSKCSQVINNRRNATQNDASSIRWPSRSDFWFILWATLVLCGTRTKYYLCHVNSTKVMQRAYTELLYLSDLAYH